MTVSPGHPLLYVQVHDWLKDAIKTHMKVNSYGVARTSSYDKCPKLDNEHSLVADTAEGSGYEGLTFSTRKKKLYKFIQRLKK